MTWQCHKVIVECALCLQSNERKLLLLLLVLTIHHYCYFTGHNSQQSHTLFAICQQLCSKFLSVIWQIRVYFYFKTTHRKCRSRVGFAEITLPATRVRDVTLGNFFFQIFNMKKILDSGARSVSAMVQNSCIARTKLRKPTWAPRTRAC